MRVALFALTGLGNAVLRDLVSMGCTVEFLCTRVEKGPHPYYPERNIAEDAVSYGIRVIYSLDEALRLAENQKIDLLLVATYHKRLGLKLFREFRYAVNLHPSLLPKYRGPVPLYWVLRNGERTTGVTAHFLTEQFDEGAVLAQCEVEIEPTDNQGVLRRKVAIAMGALSRSLISDLSSGKVTPMPQDPLLASVFPQIGDYDREINPEQRLDELVNQVRALSPWPGCRFLGKELDRVEEVVYGCVADGTENAQVIASNKIRVRFQDGSATLVFRDGFRSIGK